MGSLQSILAELRRRQVFRAAGIYVVAAWAAVQVFSLVFPAIDVPDAAIRYVWLIVLLLFPLALVFAWFYELTTSGIKREVPLATTEHSYLSLRSVDRIILAALALVGVVITWQMSGSIREVAQTGNIAVNLDADPKSIAVLPLSNVSGDSEQQYFVSGMQDALISGLSRIRDLRVTSKTSTMRFAGTSRPLRNVASELGVARLIEGSVFRVGDQVRISVQLIDAAEDREIWSDTFEDNIEDVLGLQSEVAHAIASQVEDVLAAGASRSGGARTVNPAAYEAYLKGQFHVERFTPQDMILASQYYQQAVELDPDYALAYYGLSKLCGFRAQAGVISPEQAREQCLPPLLHALELDPDLPEAQMGYGAHMTWQRFDWDEGARGFQRAIDLNPSYAEARMFYSHYLALTGRTEESIEQMRLALKLDPFNPFVRGLYAAQLMMIGDYQRCVDVLEDVMRTTPGFGFGYNVLWQAYFQLGMTEKALNAAANFYRITQGDPVGAEALEEGYRNNDYGAAMLHAAAVLEEHSKEAHVAPIAIGYMYEQAGDFEKAIDWYYIAYEKQDPDAPYMAVLAKDARVRGHPRFIQLLRNMKLDHWAEVYSQIETSN